MIVFCICINISLACEPNCPESEAYSDTNSYTNPEFYKNSKPELWNTKDSNFDWGQVTSEQIPLIPKDNIIYSKLNVVQKQSLTSGQIGVNFNNIENLGEVNIKNAEKAAFEMFDGINLDLSNINAEKVANIKEGILSTDFGSSNKYDKGKVSLTNDVYKEGLLKINKDGKIEFIPDEKVNEISIPFNDIVEVNSRDKSLFYTTSTGKKIEFNGILGMYENEVYVDYFNGQTTINGFSLGVSRLDYYLIANIYFDGKLHKESDNPYVSFDEDNMILSSSPSFVEETPPTIKFNKGNEIFDINEDNLLVISGIKNGVVNIRKRKGLIPDIKFNELEYEEDSNIHILNGNHLMKLENGEFHELIIPNPVKSSQYYDSEYKYLKTIDDVIESVPSDNVEEIADVLYENFKARSIPLVISYEDETGNNLLKVDDGGQKILFNGYNQMIMIPEDESSGFTVPSKTNEFPPVLLSEDYDYNAVIINKDIIEKEYPNMEIIGNPPPVALKMFYDSVQNIPSELTDKLNRVYFHSNEEFYSIAQGSAIAQTFPNGDVHINQDNLREPTIYHENTHVYLKKYDIEQGNVDADTLETLEKIAENLEKIRVLKTRGIENLEESEKIKLSLMSYTMDLQSRSLNDFGKYDNIYKGREVKKHPLEKEWMELVGNYDKSNEIVAIHESENGRFKSWTGEDKKSPEASEPRYGFMDPHSAQNFLEDSGGSVEKINTKPDIYKSLINPNENEWAGIYRGKLDLLYKHGWIEKDKYEYIISSN